MRSAEPQGAGQVWICSPEDIYLPETTFPKAPQPNPALREVSIDEKGGGGVSPPVQNGVPSQLLSQTTALPGNNFPPLKKNRVHLCLHQFFLLSIDLSHTYLDLLKNKSTYRNIYFFNYKKFQFIKMEKMIVLNLQTVKSI